jgi:hypothetical protein
MEAPAAGETAMTTAATITAAFDAQKIHMVNQMVAGFERDLAEMKAEFGDDLGGAYTSRYWSSYWVSDLRPLCTLVGAQTVGFRTVGGVWVLDVAKATAQAEAWATAELEAACAKLIAKVGNLKHVKIIGSPERGIFTLVGHHPNYATVRVEQTRILKSSGKGKLFNQWPARIYVDGRPVSEESFKRISPRPEDRVLPEISL